MLSPYMFACRKCNIFMSPISRSMSHVCPECTVSHNRHTATSTISENPNLEVSSFRVCHWQALSVIRLLLQYFRDESTVVRCGESLVPPSIPIRYLVRYQALRPGMWYPWATLMSCFICHETTQTWFSLQQEQRRRRRRIFYFSQCCCDCKIW